jgi:hypothetical protein
VNKNYVHVSSHGTDVDDEAMLSLGHMGYDGLGHAQDIEDSDREIPLYRVHGLIHECAWSNFSTSRCRTATLGALTSTAGTGIVDENIDPPMFLHYLAYDTLDRNIIAGVARYHVHVSQAPCRV